MGLTATLAGFVDAELEKEKIIILMADCGKYPRAYHEITR